MTTMTSTKPVSVLFQGLQTMSSYDSNFCLLHLQSKGADRKLKVEMQKLEHKTKEELVRHL